MKGEEWRRCVFLSELSRHTCLAFYVHPSHILYMVDVSHNLSLVCISMLTCCVAYPGCSQRIPITPLVRFALQIPLWCQYSDCLEAAEAVSHLVTACFRVFSLRLFNMA
ncbi:uncharacterized protein M421DRAFT_271373 [Didymella exigua CBS 183.55]|uniref:Uncharacterized protein n=1 Tax=Didymella exigua CBS 183.55 TaxID=1150837 RepID=A0A6A5RB06_9PLEO|nr:uncharacterized protein M421DRAFT_271373 [Didymella exigua CBS 183.55]KAF1924822.1 hypothetical protein M421DRAFT_271373 [Didymella exigua CBS 183.55]